MSEQLNIETLRQKFKEAQARGEELVLMHPNIQSEIYIISAIGKFHVLAVHYSGSFEATIGCRDIPNWKIKQPKDEYEVLYEYTYAHYELGQLLALSSREGKGMTGRKLLRNKRTNEIVEYDEGLLK